MNNKVIYLILALIIALAIDIVFNTIGASNDNTLARFLLETIYNPVFSFIAFAIGAIYIFSHPNKFG
jgi:hypothetical protein